MSKDGFDMSEMDDFAKQLIELADKTMPKESKKFMMSEGNKLKRVTVNKAKQRVKKVTGNYLKGLKRGRVYKYKGDETAIRVYGGSPHAHLIEYGHRQVTKDGKEIGFTKGAHVFEHARKDFEQTFVSDLDQFVDDMLTKGLR